MEQLSLLFQNQKKEPPLLKIVTTQDEFTQKTEEILSWILNHHFHYWNYNCYKMRAENGKISKIYFWVGKNKFSVYIDYQFLKSTHNHIDYTETNKDDREKTIESVNIKNLKISAIQKKVKVWYGEVKDSVNYFKYLGIDYISIKLFLDELLKNYHK